MSVPMFKPASFVSAIRRAILRLRIAIIVLVPCSSSLSAVGETAFPALGVENDPLWLRYPSISPDGTTIAFSFRGHIFTVPVRGGLAMPLTAGPAHDSSPVWSPDGKLIAFASDRYGHYDVFLTSSQGGMARRLTTYSTDAVPTSFTADGQYVLFNGYRMGSAQSSLFPVKFFPQLYKVSIQGGRAAEMLLTTPALHAQYDREQNRILYEDLKGYEDPWRKHETFSVAHDIWFYDARTGNHTKLSTFQGENRNPIWSPDESSIFYLSEESGSFNIWRLSLTDGLPGSAQQLTNFQRNPVRFLSAANTGDLCFGYDGEIYTLPVGATQPQKVTIHIGLSESAAATQLRNYGDNVTEIALSPNGKEFAFVVRGDIYVASVDQGETKRITNTPGQERSISFSPDGRRLVFAAEYARPWGIYEAAISQPKEKEPYFFNSTVIDIHPILENDQENFQPRYSPDGKEVAYLENRTTLKVLNLETKQTRIILPGHLNYSYEDGDQWFDWSPDGKWFLASFLTPERWASQAGLVDAGGQQQLTNLTKSGYDNLLPRWMKDGKSMIWFSDKYGLHGDGGSAKSQQDVYEMFFTQEAYDRSKLSKAEYDILAESEAEQKKKNSEKKEEAKETDANAPKKIEPLAIDLNNIENRIDRLTLGSSQIADGLLTNDGETLLYLAKNEKGYDLWSLKPRESELKRLWGTEVPKSSPHGESSPAMIRLDKDSKNVFVLAAGKVTKIGVADGKAEPAKFNAAKELDAVAERGCLFEHIWREMREKFYLKDMNGVDWDYYKSVYAKFLPYISDDRDFSEMISEMLGELNASHTGCKLLPDPQNADAIAVLGAFFDSDYKGTGLRIQEVVEKGPLITASATVRAGMIIEKINGVTIDPGMDFSSLLNHRAGQPTLLSIFDEAKNVRFDVTVKPISIGEQDELLYQRWVKQRRELVDKLSNNTVGYIHVRGMNDESYRDAYSEALGRESKKKALIVDTRYNGGGNLHDTLAVFLSGKPYLEFLPRGQSIGWEPNERWRGKSLVLASESNYSDAQLFPWIYQHFGIGKLVGMPVPGTGTAVWWEFLQDPRLIFGIPEVGFRDEKGQFMEKTQVEPDVKVRNDAKSIAEGKDNQLEKAVEILMQD
ncbi:MAG: PD40 domain-containing protein [Verrucomicrobia bacterium]|nr:PD40 domain-containing protein [Verrucomicrobiota bacterium]